MILPEQIIVYGSVLISIALALLLIAVVSSYVGLLRKYRALLEEKTKLKAIAEVELDKILEEGRQKSLQIVEEANIRAGKIVGDAGVLSEQIKAKMLEELGKVTSQYATGYQDVLDEAKNEAVKTIVSISKDIGSEASRQIETMRQTLKQEIARVQQSTKGAIDEAYKKVEEEVKVYRHSKMQKVDAQVYQIVRQVCQEVIGKIIEGKEHEELVIKALEDAKRQRAL